LFQKGSSSVASVSSSSANATHWVRAPVATIAAIGVGAEVATIAAIASPQ
jgi:hypothetical protein